MFFIWTQRTLLAACFNKVPVIHLIKKVLSPTILFRLLFFSQWCFFFLTLISRLTHATPLNTPMSDWVFFLFFTFVLVLCKPVDKALFFYFIDMQKLRFQNLAVRRETCVLLC